MMHSPWLMWPLFCFVLVSMVVFASVAFNKNVPRMQRFTCFILLLACTYLLGAALKFMFIGPDFVRWHLADFGFPIVIAVMYGTGFSFLDHRNHPGRDIPAARRSYMKGAMVQVMAPVAVLVSYSYELFTHCTPRSMTGATSAVGRWDWVDIACYTLGGLVIYFVAQRHRRSMATAINEYEETQAHLAKLQARKAELEAVAAKAATRPRARSSNRKRSKRKRR